MKQIIVGSLMVALAMSAAHATITVYGDKEMLEGDEGHVAAYTDIDGVTPTLYAQVKNTDTLKPWQGYWSVTLPNAYAAEPIKLVIPKP